MPVYPGSICVALSRSCGYYGYGLHVFFIIFFTPFTELCKQPSKGTILGERTRLGTQFRRFCHILTDSGCVAQTSNILQNMY